jgi:multicomponent Na+:H+ antiporter subunit D
VSAEHLLIWIPLVPLLAACGVVAARGNPNLREGVSIGAGVILFLLVAGLAASIDWQAPPTLVIATPVAGLSLALTPEPLGMLFALVASLLWPITTVYAVGYMRAHHEQNQTRFYTAFAVSIAAAMCIALAGNMFTLFVFYEVLSVSTYPLVTHAGTDKAKRAGRVYLGLLMGTSIGFLLLAMIWTWNLTGTLDFTPGGVFTDEVGGGVLGILLLLYVFGTGKAALMPFHRWLPAAMVAPTPVSALLHAVAVVKAGVFTVLKVSVYIFGLERIEQMLIAEWLVALAALTIVLASTIALRQDNFKARLAYSTVSQLSYITMGASLGVATGAIGGGLHIAMHAFGKITLFFCAGAVLVTAHKSKISELNGIGRRMPWTMGAFAIGAVSMIGAPPFAGFVSKWYLLSGALQTDQLIAVAALIISTLLNAAYFMPIVYAAFFKAEDDGHGHVTHGEAPLPIVLALSTTALFTILIFFFPDIPLSLVQQMVGG